MDLERPEQYDLRDKVHEVWRKLPDENQAWYEAIGLMHYDRIVLVDEIGDAWHQGPHILVEHIGDKGPFDLVTGEIQQWHGDANKRMRPTHQTRVRIFPSHMPESE